MRISAGNRSPLIADPPAVESEVSSEQDGGWRHGGGSECGGQRPAAAEGLPETGSAVLHEWRTSPPDPPRRDGAGPEGRE